jgi:hypothetical protein
MIHVAAHIRWLELNIFGKKGKGECMLYLALYKAHNPPKCSLSEFGCGIYEVLKEKMALNCLDPLKVDSSNLQSSVLTVNKK